MAGVYRKESNLNVNNLIVDVLVFPAVLKQAGYPYITIKYVGDDAVWNVQSQIHPLFNVLEIIASSIIMNDDLIPQHPLIRLMFYLMKSKGLVTRIAYGELRLKPSESFVEELNDFLFTFLKITETDSCFKKQLSNLSRIDSRNTESMQNYIDALFNCYSRLLVVRVDFHYRKTEYEYLTLERVADDRDSFLRMAKRQYRNLVGLCWKLEYGKDRTFHYHMLFFFNGAEVRQDVTFGQQLGELWVSITGNVGTYFNCNADKSRYEQCYLGQINYFDYEKRGALLQANYLTKADENIIAVQLDGKYRIFGRMELPFRTSAAGRPRNHPGIL